MASKSMALIQFVESIPAGSRICKVNHVNSRHRMRHGVLKQLVEEFVDQETSSLGEESVMNSIRLPLVLRTPSLFLDPITESLGESRTLKAPQGSL